MEAQSSLSHCTTVRLSLRACSIGTTSPTGRSSDDHDIPAQVVELAVERREQVIQSRLRHLRAPQRSPGGQREGRPRDAE
jgi:hypothetical protein